MADGPTSDMAAEGTASGLSKAVPPKRRWNTSRQVDSDGYKGDDEDDDYGVSVKSDAAAGSGHATGGTTPSGDADIDAYVAAYMCKEDVAFIKTLSKGIRTKQLIKKPKTASRERTEISTACESTLTTPASVGDVRNTLGIRHPSDTLPPNAVGQRNTRDPSPTYNQNTTNLQTPNPTYSPKRLHARIEPTLDNPCLQPENASFQEGGQTTTAQAVGQRRHDHPQPALGLDNPCTQPGALAASCQETMATSALAVGDDHIQPYAVRSREEDDVDITPYAVAYMCQGDTDSTEEDTKTPSSSDVDTDVLQDSRQAPVQNTLNPNPRSLQNALSRNPMYAQNALNPNPVPNAVQEVACVCTSRWVCAAVTAAVVLVLLILVGTLSGLCLNTSEQGSQRPTQPVDTARTTGQPTPDTPSTPDHPACCSSGKTTVVDLLPTGDALPSTANSSQESYAGNVKSKPIVFGGKGTSPGQMDEPTGVAVSADNEIFVADANNKRVQVFSMKGAFLRLFSTKVPGGNHQAMYPTDVDIDEQGRIWVVGKDRASSGAVRVVQYRTDGLSMITFDVERSAWYPKIAVNARHNKIIVVASDEVLKFNPDGSFDGSFGKEKGAGLQYVTSDRDGNILVTAANDPPPPGVRVYDHNGQRQFSFRTANIGMLVGICMDPQGHIMVAVNTWISAGRVNMFTSGGEFVRMAVNVTAPWGIALGPGGQLVVTHTISERVTIFPRWMVFPDE
ncbi:PREDICTED: uncharacterized protein LOC109477478 [Branchiostoma belcheri]|uniref:Uncharacterized protein LOC109477478 n=1 Tax=Branchiostoma belcheri TaxID=7741 RepID=A0A6P4ZXJ4_BRABE|nr:PREDICTED: uncharacterized protein LOC109477478 [Branchiostoma belcheri]